jgi:hypothetical protein
MGRTVLERLLEFLQLPVDEAYLDVAVDAFKADRSRRKAQRLLRLYSDQVLQKFERHPALRNALLRFAR